MSSSYENKLDDWINQEKSGVNLLNSVGTLMYDKGIELILFRNQLLEIDFVNTTVSSKVDAAATTGVGYTTTTTGTTTSTSVNTTTSTTTSSGY